MNKDLELVSYRYIYGQIKNQYMQIMRLCLNKKQLVRVFSKINYKYLDHLDSIAHNPMTKSQMHVNHISLLRKYK